MILERNSGDPVHITRVDFRNCQSLCNISYELTPGLNVIVAPDNDGNSTGKSVFFKMLRMAVGSDFFEGNELIHLITYGQTAASVLFTLSDGSAGGFLATVKEVIYLWKEDGTAPIEKLTAPHPDFLRKMSIVMDDKTKFVLNILDSDELLFVNSREDTNFSSLKLISDNETLEELIPAIEEKAANFKTYKARAEQTNGELHRKLSNLERYDLNELEHAVKEGDNLLPILSEVLQIKDLITAIQANNITDINHLTLILQAYHILQNIKQHVNKLKAVKKIKQENNKLLLNKYRSLSQISESVRLIKQIAEDHTENCETFLHFYQQVERLQKNLAEIIQTSRQQLGKCNDILPWYKRAVELLASLNTIIVNQETDGERTREIFLWYQVVDKVQEIINEVAFTSQETEMKKLSAELETWNRQVIDCPVKGKVLFFEDGCIECIQCTHEKQEDDNGQASVPCSE